MVNSILLVCIKILRGAVKSHALIYCIEKEVNWEAQIRTRYLSVIRHLQSTISDQQKSRKICLNFSIH